MDIIGDVLIAEDEKDLASLWKLLLEDHFRVTVVTDGASAIEQAERGAESGAYFCLFVLDVEMPQGDGLEVLRRLRAMPHTQDVPVIVITANREKFEAAALAAGASRVIGKSRMDQDEFVDTALALAGRPDARP